MRSGETRNRKKLFTGTIKQMLESEMSEYFDYEKNSVDGNGKNGYGKKTIYHFLCYI